MCGLFGMAGPGVHHDDLVFLRELAYTSGLRGIDGTGILQASAYKRSIAHRLVKNRSEVSYYLWFNDNHEEGDPRILSSVADNVFMGHVRAATKGEVSDANAHPFDVGSFIGAHNGTLSDKKYQSKEKTDSELMFRDIEERGLETVLSELDENSAYAISIFDKRTGRLTFARNHRRPLCYAYHKKRKVVYWASERGMLEFIAQRQSYGIGLDIGKIFKFSENAIYTFHPLDVNVNALPDFDITFVKPLWVKKKLEEEAEAPKVPLITHQTTERENLTNVLLMPQRPPLNLNLRKSDSPLPIKSDLLKPCEYCKKPLDLLAQYEGVEIQPNKYVCRPCEDINQQLMKEHLLKHSPTKGMMN